MEKLVVALASAMVSGGLTVALTAGNVSGRLTSVEKSLERIEVRLDAINGGKAK